MTADCIALMVSDFEDGGVERNFTRLATGLARLGVDTQLLTGVPNHPYLRDVDHRVRIVPFVGDRAAFLRRHLTEAKVDVLVTGKLADDYAAVAIKQAIGASTSVIAAVGTLMSGRFKTRRFNPVRTWLETRRIRACYRQLDGMTAVSEAVAEDLRHTFKVEGVPLRVLNNPIIPDDLEARLAGPCPHPWLADNQPPVIVALGGLRKIKDHATLLRAFSQLPKATGVRLLILGEGKERTRLEQLSRDLGISDRLDLHGFVANPFPYLARSRLLALSSRREGLPNVIVEAFSVGTPVVATDCTEGVRNLLDGGRLGRLVPVGDDRALAGAIEASLAERPAAETLREAAAPFGLMPAAQAYLTFFREVAALQAASSDIAS
jgi:glycosyltransferase involved in cell wall biosynthesis